MAEARRSVAEPPRCWTSGPLRVAFAAPWSRSRRCVAEVLLTVGRTAGGGAAAVAVVVVTATARSRSCRGVAAHAGPPWSHRSRWRPPDTVLAPLAVAVAVALVLLAICPGRASNNTRVPYEHRVAAP